MLITLVIKRPHHRAPLTMLHLRVQTAVKSTVSTEVKYLY